jgi:hypothetical protein
MSVERRDFLKIFSVGTVAAMSGQLVHRGLSDSSGFVQEHSGLSGFVLEDVDTSVLELADSIEFMSTTAPSSSAYLNAFQAFAEQHTQVATSTSPDLKQYLSKMANFERLDQGDKFLERKQYPVLISSFKRLDRVQNLVGHGNFNVISFDETLKYGKRYTSIGEFTRQEQDFLASLFSANASHYGFRGEKVTTELTANVPERARHKIRGTGHFLYRGESEALYRKLKRDLGNSVVLTSGIRSVVKQSHLFLAKTIQSKGNLSKASRSLAPPGHSYHGIGDFDVGKVGFGRKNFTEEFAATDEFKRLVDLGYVDIRYPRGNMFGVRYEPWHIKVV